MLVYQRVHSKMLVYQAEYLQTIQSKMCGNTDTLWWSYRQFSDHPSTDGNQKNVFLNGRSKMDPKMELPIPYISYKAYFSGLCKWISPQNMVLYVNY